MRALDLFCGAGGSARGLIKADFTVIGVDIVDQPHYPGSFIRGDALALSVDFIRGFDFVWASPPCQRYTSLRHAPGKHRDADLIDRARALVIAAGVPYCIENVEAAGPWLRNPVLLCGSMFGLSTHPYPEGWRLERYRLFETSFPVTAPACRHDDRPFCGVYGRNFRDRRRSAGTNHKPNSNIPRELGFRAMGIPPGAMTTAEISDALLPAYAHFIAQQFLNSRSAHADRDDGPARVSRGGP